MGGHMDDNIVYFQLVVEQKGDATSLGAANFWIKEEDYNLAFQKASETIDQAGWQVKDIQQALLTNRNSYSDPEQLKMFEKAVEGEQVLDIQPLEATSVVVDSEMNVSQAPES